MSEEYQRSYWELMRTMDDAEDFFDKARKERTKRLSVASASAAASTTSRAGMSKTCPPASSISVFKQSHRDLLSLDARPPERLNNLRGGFLLHIHQGKTFLDFDRADQTGRHTRFIRDGADQIARPDAGRSPRPDVHPHGSSCPTTPARAASRGTRPISL